MKFMEISSLEAAYRNVVKIKKNFKKKNERDFGFVNSSQKKNGKGNLNLHNKK